MNKEMNENNIDWIETVKLQENGYLINGTINVPKANGNRHYEEIKAWLETNTVTPEFTADELAQQEADKALRDAKTIGLPYIDGGENISFTSADATGLLQVKAAFELDVTSTNIRFSNGTVLPMTNTEFKAFAIWFTKKRNAFFI